MNSTMLSEMPAVNNGIKKCSVAGLFRALLLTRQEMRRISMLARRERLQLGYQRIPRRVWDRRSALFIDHASLAPGRCTRYRS